MRVRHIYFCDLCHRRVSDQDLQRGLGGRRDDTTICHICLDAGYGRHLLGGDVTPTPSARMAAANVQQVSLAQAITDELPQPTDEAGGALAEISVTPLIDDDSAIAAPAVTTVAMTAADEHLVAPLPGAPALDAAPAPPAGGLGGMAAGLGALVRPPAQQGHAADGLLSEGDPLMAGRGSARQRSSGSRDGSASRGGRPSSARNSGGASSSRQASAGKSGRPTASQGKQSGAGKGGRPTNSGRPTNGRSSQRRDASSGKSGRATGKQGGNDANAMVFAIGGFALLVIIIIAFVALRGGGGDKEDRSAPAKTQQASTQKKEYSSGSNSVGRPTLQGLFKEGEVGKPLPSDGGLKRRCEQVYQEVLAVQRGSPTLAQVTSVNDRVQSLRKDVYKWIERAEKGGSSQYQIDQALHDWEFKNISDQDKAVRDLLAKLQGIHGK